ncbi:MAG: hypothetical protein WDZ73_01555 [Candidatus Paceibacterota bacterium]
MAKKTNKKSGFGTKLALGVGAIAAIAGGYLLYGPEGEKNRKQIKSWMIKARGDMLSEIEKMKDVTKGNYDLAVEKIVAKYAKLKDVGEKDAVMLKKDLQKYWKHIQADIKKIADKK